MINEYLPLMRFDFRICRETRHIKLFIFNPCLGENEYTKSADQIFESDILEGESAVNAMIKMLEILVQ